MSLSKNKSLPWSWANKFYISTFIVQWNGLKMIFKYVVKDIWHVVKDYLNPYDDDYLPPSKMTIAYIWLGNAAARNLYVTEHFDMEYDIFSTVMFADAVDERLKNQSSPSQLM